MPIRTLFVDDEKTLLEQAKIFLEREDEIKIHTVSSAEKALNLIKEDDFDVIVSDYQMPKIDGLEFLEKIRKESDSKIPFIMFTGKGREEVAIKALNLGADRYIQKGGNPKSQYSVLADSIKQEFEHWKSKKKLEESEKEKSVILERTSDVIAYHDSEHNIIWANRSYLEGAEKTLEEIKGEKCYDAWYGRDEPCEGCPTDEALKSGEVEKGEIYPPEGDRHWLITATPIKDEEGNIIRIVETSLDITEWKRQKKELKRKERYLDHTPEYITVLDEEGNIKYHSYPSDEIKGLDPSEFMGSEAIEFAHPDDREDVLEMFSKVLEDPDKEYSTELRGKVEDGWIWLEIRAVNCLDDPEVNGIIITAQDISERKEMEKKLRESEKEYKRVAENINDLITMVDQKREILYGNEKAHKELLGFEIDDIIGQKAFDFFHPDDREKVITSFEEAIEEGKKKQTVEARFRCKDGSYKWVESSGRFFPDGKVLVVSRDITERKEAKKRVEENRDKIERLHEISAELQTSDSEDEVYSLAIEAAEDILDFDICSFDAVEGDMFVLREISTATPEDGHTNRPIEEGGLAKRTYLNQESYIVDDLFEDKDAKPVKSDYRSAISVPIGEQGVFQAVSTEVDHFDEEDLKTAELLISHVSQALERIQIKNREDFLHSLLRHDVGNKIQVIQGYVQLLEDEITDEGPKEMVHKAEKATKDAQNLIEKVRTLRDVIAEHERDDVDVSSILESVISNYKERLDEQDIELEYEKEEIRAQGGSLLKEVFSNLLENAIKHAECDKISISLEEKDSQVIVSIEDEGVGISDDDKDKIFERGYKSGELGGSGLGLFLVKEILNGYGGDIDVEDSDLGGAKFEIRLKNAKN